MANGELQDRQVSNRGQAWQQVSRYTMWRRSVRVRIKRDSYDQQSYATAEVWTGNGWVEAYTLLDPAILKVQRHDPGVAREAAVDERRLLEQVWHMLSLG